ncbi:fumarylacetoacetate hydrolase family protein [Cohnella suwonensis]|uniref:Fumarylacetoacetate hydrolase family protein n=1 Tax=Cohnella suwonensis TaxID=696072 RepID=A0ABW0LWK8_9BACL
MKLVTLAQDGEEVAALAIGGGAEFGSRGDANHANARAYVLLSTINTATGRNWCEDAFGLVSRGQLEEVAAWYGNGGEALLSELPRILADEAVHAPLYRFPRKIWGIGFNYAADEEERRSLLAAGHEPVGFLKPDTALIGPGDEIVLPAASERVKAEAELAVVIGKRCKDVAEADAPGVVAGFAAALDMTADDIHARNPRFLTRAKSFDTFFGFGSELITLDEFGDVGAMAVETYHNGELSHSNVVSNMLVGPWAAVAYLSQGMTLLPGDVILTGTPGPVVVRGGDVVECRIAGFRPFELRVSRE